MQHVDEGTIHAWLDEQITDPAEAAWIDEHLRTCTACGARMAEERATFDRARTLLASAVPAAERPSFESLVARSASVPRVDVESRPVARSSSAAVWLRAGWAASIVLALGLGWAARDLTGGGAPESVLDDADRVERVESTQQAVAAEAAPPAVVAPLPAAPESSEKLSASGSSAPASVAPAGGAPQGQLAGLEQLSPSVLPPAAANREFALTQAAAARGAAANAPAEPGVIGTPQAAQGAIAGAAAPPAAPLPAPPPPAAAGEAARMIAAAPRVEAEAAAGRSQFGAMAVTGGTAAAPASAAEWRPVPRTEAAVRVGMPLYGIEGLTAVVTSVSADGRSVRTLYRAESGELVELTQSRGAIDPRLLAAPPMPVDTAARALAPGARSAVLSDAAPPAQRTWTTTLGEVRVLLRTTATTADLDALGARLRVD